MDSRTTAEPKPVTTKRWTSGLLLALPLVVAAAILWIRWPDAGPDPIDITASGPVYESVDELVAASDLIITGQITSSAPGRVITDPSDPTAGIRTTVFTIEVGETLRGDPTTAVTIEYETALLDRTPITINGVTAPANNERGLYFLISGSGQDFPHYAIANHQGRFIIDEEQVLKSTGQTDSLSARISATPLDGLKTQLRS